MRGYQELPTTTYEATIKVMFTVNAETYDSAPIPEELIKQGLESAVMSISFDEVASNVMYEEMGYVEDEDGDKVDRAESITLSTVMADTLSLRDVTAPLAGMMADLRAGPPTLTESALPEDAPQPDNFWASTRIKSS